MHGASLELFQVSWLSVSNNIYKCWQITYFQGQLVKGKQKRCRKVGSRLFWEGINVWNVNQNWFSPDSPQLFGWLVASQWINCGSFKKSISHVLPTCPWFSWVPDVIFFLTYFNFTADPYLYARTSECYIFKKHLIKGTDLFWHFTGWQQMKLTLGF